MIMNEELKTAIDDEDYVRKQLYLGRQFSVAELVEFDKDNKNAVLYAYETRKCEILWLMLAQICLAPNGITALSKALQTKVTVFEKKWDLGLREEVKLDPAEMNVLAAVVKNEANTPWIRAENLKAVSGMRTIGELRSVLFKIKGDMNDYSCIDDLISIAERPDIEDVAQDSDYVTKLKAERELLSNTGQREACDKEQQAIAQKPLKAAIDEKAKAYSSQLTVAYGINYSAWMKPKEKMLTELKQAKENKDPLFGYMFKAYQPQLQRHWDTEHREGVKAFVSFQLNKTIFGGTTTSEREAVAIKDTSEGDKVVRRWSLFGRVGS